MKLMNAMKQLKFWSKKKKRKKMLQSCYKLAHDHQYHYNYNYTPPPTTYAYNPPPPPPRPPPPRPPQQPPRLCEWHYCDSSEPSAPPLPPWLESTHESYSDHPPWLDSTHDDSYSDHPSLLESMNETYSDHDHPSWLESTHVSERCLNQPTWLQSTHESESCSIQPTWLESTHESYSSAGQMGSSDEHCIGIDSDEETPNGSKLSKADQQQYMAPYSEEREPLIGMSGSGKRQPSKNPFGCVMEVGAFLFRCFIPSEQRSFQHSAATLEAAPGRKMA